MRRGENDSSIKRGLSLVRNYDYKTHLPPVPEPARSDPKEISNKKGAVNLDRILLSHLSTNIIRRLPAMNHRTSTKERTVNPKPYTVTTQNPFSYSSQKKDLENTQNKSVQNKNTIELKKPEFAYQKSVSMTPNQLVKAIPNSNNQIKKQEFVRQVQRMTETDLFVMKKGSLDQDKLYLLYDYGFKMNFSNRILVSIPQDMSDGQYVYNLSKWNNANLIKRIFDRRVWWKHTNSPLDYNCNFAWTQFPIIKFQRKIKSSMRFLSKEKTPPGIETDTSDQNVGKPIVGKLANIIPVYQKTHLKWMNDTDCDCLFNLQMRKGLPMWECEPSILSENLKKNEFINTVDLKILKPNRILLTNKLENNIQYGHKSAMFLNLKHYCLKTSTDLFSIVPETYLITHIDCPSFLQLQTAFNRSEIDKNIWIVKPAENTFGGSGISIFSNYEECQTRLKHLLSSDTGNSENQTTHKQSYIVQKYIEKPLLFEGRKFDIRAYFLITSYNSRVKAYWYPLGYIRTSSSSFSLSSFNDLSAHLTNDCYQKKTNKYGKYESGNKIMYSHFFKCMQDKYPNWKNKAAVDSSLSSLLTISVSLYEFIDKQMREISVHLVKSTSRKFDPQRRLCSFEHIGLDFMIDENFKVLLLEANNSPSLSHSENREMNTFLEDLMEDVFQVAVDPLFPPPRKCPLLYTAKNPLHSNKFELIYDETRDYDIDLGDTGEWGYIYNDRT